MKVNYIAILNRVKSFNLVPEDIQFIPGYMWECRVDEDLGSVVVIGLEPLPTPGERTLDEVIVKEFGHTNILLRFLFCLFHEVGHHLCHFQDIENNKEEEAHLKLAADLLSSKGILTEEDREKAMQIERKYRLLEAEAKSDQIAIDFIKSLFKMERRNSKCTNI